MSDSDTKKSDSSSSSYSSDSCSSSEEYSEYDDRTKCNFQGRRFTLSKSSDNKATATLIVNSDENLAIKSDSESTEEDNTSVKDCGDFTAFFKYQENVERMKTLSENSESTNLSHDSSVIYDHIENYLNIGEECEVVSEPIKSKYFQKTDNESDSEWQDVPLENNEPTVKDVEIMLNFDKNSKKKKDDEAAILERERKKHIRNVQILMHKTHILCYMSFGMNLNSILNSTVVLGSALSLLCSDNIYPKYKVDLEYLSGLVQSYCKQIKLNHIDNIVALDSLEDNLISEIHDRKIKSKYRYIFGFIVLCRVIGLRCRLIISLQCVPLRPNSSRSNFTKIKKVKKSSSTIGKKKRKKSNFKIEESSGDSDCKITENTAGTSSHYFNRNKKQGKEIDIRPDIIKIMTKRMADEENNKKATKSIKKRKLDDNVDEDQEETDELIRKKMISQTDKRILSTEDESDSDVTEMKLINNQFKRGMDYWTEVFLEEEEKWITVDVLNKAVHCIDNLVKNASHPITYVIAWDNCGRAKDVSQRYCENWNTITRKLRVDNNWWQETLNRFRGRETIHDRMEEEDFYKQELDKPLPKSIAEYKNNPLYVLKRHLLKFEAIYPPNALILGYVRNEEVYSRECVKTLHSREIWLKDAKTVRRNEKPYKIVKSRPKYDRTSNSYISNLPLELFGDWQVEDYKPQKVVNGIIPRNAYGNVDLFKPCMLPEGAVYLKLNGLIKIARKLGIDCAPAVTGFEFHSGVSHPVFDGFVVPSKYENILTNAWSREQAINEARIKEKRENRIYANWKKLIKGILIKERLRVKYNIEN